MSNAVSPSLPLSEDESDETTTTPQGKEAVRWEVVAQTSGLLAARIIADRLQTEGIPARAWQESVGQAFGMVVGPLGTGNVSVPEEYVDAAQEILADIEEGADFLYEEGDEPADET